MADEVPIMPPDSQSASGRTITASQPPQLPVLRFGLRHLLGFVALLCALLAAIASSGGMMQLVLLLAALVITLHVAGTALGSRLRAHADQQRAWEAEHEPAVATSSPAAAVSSTAPAQPPLYGRRSSLRWLRVFVAGGALVGTLGGAATLALTIGHRTGPMGIAVGAISLGVVGGWIAFLGTSFWTIIRQGWREAVDHQKQDQARSTVPRR